MNQAFKKILPLKSYVFSEQQSTWRLLIALRLLACGSVIALFLIGEWQAFHVLQMMVNWQHMLVAASFALALSLIGYITQKRNITTKHIYIQLFIDTFLWFYLLHASGGAMNPAVSYLLILLCVAALSLPLSHVLSLLLVMMGLYTLMMRFQPADHQAHMFEWHLWGMWLLFLLNALIMMAVIYLLSRKLRQKDQAIADFQQDTVRSEQVIMLGTMAANITHELGTPLSTIAMLVEEADIEQGPLIKKQISRCKEALALLKSVSFDNELVNVISCDEYFQQLIKELLLIKPTAIVVIDKIEKVEIHASRLLTQALLALINNAVEAAKYQVTIKAYIANSHFIIEIEHDGQAIAENLIQQLGIEPVESSRDGLGIGYYLANVSIERLGGRLKIDNRAGSVITTVIFSKANLIR